MPVFTLAFAESLIHDHDGNSHSDFLSDDQTFPPLSSTTTGFELIRDDVLFTGENTVWVNSLSYAEAAENGGVVHEPINIDSTFALPAITYEQYSPKAPAIRTKYDQDDCMDTLYYDFKSLSADKAAAEHTICARKLRTAEYTYHRDLRKNIKKLPDGSSDMTPEDASLVQEAKELVSRCDKIMDFLGPYYLNHLYMDEPRNRFKVKDWHSTFRRRTLRKYKNDPMFERLFDEFEAYVHHRLPLIRGGPNRLTSSSWHGYNNMTHIGLRGLRERYNYVIEDAEGVDPSISRKERLWRIRSAIPAKKYMGSNASRTQCAYTILNEICH